MTEQEGYALEHVAMGAVLFHDGFWGGPVGFVWAGPDGQPAGRVPQWESEVLMLLEQRGLVAVVPGLGARDRPVVVTDSGRRLLPPRAA